MKIYEYKMCDFEDIRDDPQSADAGAKLVKTYKDAWEIAYDEFVASHDDGTDDELPEFKMKPYVCEEGLYGTTIVQFWEMIDDVVIYTIYEHDLELMK